MTRDEAKDFLTKISYALGNMSVEYLSEKDGEKMREAIKALEQESILDKIRAEIETDLSHFCFDEWGNENLIWKEIKAIIDKYKAESEDKE